MRVLLLGGAGQLGREVQAAQPEDVLLTAPARSEADISESASLARLIDSVNPEVVINAAAYTAVDRAEDEPAEAYAANAQGPRHLAKLLAGTATRLIHVSTDFVFDGEKTTPYRPEDDCNPLGVYGASKLEGERAVLETMPDSALVVRTSWVYSSHRGNFVKTMLRLLAERDQVGVVSDQLGSPTWARGLAGALWRWVEHGEAVGVRHWADEGVTSWYDLAMAISEEAAEVGLLEAPATVLPISTSEYPTAAVRPAMSALDSSQSWAELSVEPAPWRDALRTMLLDHHERSDG